MDEQQLWRTVLRIFWRLHIKQAIRQRMARSVDGFESERENASRKPVQDVPAMAGAPSRLGQCRWLFGGAGSSAIAELSCVQTHAVAKGGQVVIVARKQLRACSSPMRERSQTINRRSAPQDARTVSFFGLHPIWNTSSL